MRRISSRTAIVPAVPFAVFILAGSSGHATNGGSVTTGSRTASAGSKAAQLVKLELHDSPLQGGVTVTVK